MKSFLLALFLLFSLNNLTAQSNIKCIIDGKKTILFSLNFIKPSDIKEIYLFHGNEGQKYKYLFSEKYDSIVVIEMQKYATLNRFNEILSDFNIDSLGVKKYGSKSFFGNLNSSQKENLFLSPSLVEQVSVNKELFNPSEKYIYISHSYDSDIGNIEHEVYKNIKHILKKYKIFYPLLER